VILRTRQEDEIGVLDAYGHVSVRDPRNPNRYYLSRAISAGMVTAADIIEYDLDSQSIGNNRPDGYLERFIHGEIYKARPDVMAVIHAHSPEMIAFGASSVPLRNMIHTGSFINDGVPVFDVRKFGGTADDMLIRNSAIRLGDTVSYLEREPGAKLPTNVAPAGAAANNRAWEYWKRQVTTR
jgi:ribulose-5-phosphate 4-epimerase/fuculose-1-phosphate aldolase